MVDIIFKKPIGSKIYILAPLVKNEKGTHKDTLNKFHLQGFERFRVDGEVYRYSEILSNRGFLEASIGIGKPRRKNCLLDIFCLRFSLAPDQSET